MSTSSPTITGAWPPSSMVVRFMPSAASLIRCLPTGIEPVNEILRITGEASSRVDIASGTPKTSATTPSGMPASISAVAMFIADAGVSSAGLRMQLQPAASAAPSLRAGLPSGKFQGANAATGPTGSLTTVIRVPLARLGNTRP